MLVVDMLEETAVQCSDSGELAHGISTSVPFSCPSLMFSFLLRNVSF